MSERSNVHAWKACIPQGIGGSNPLLSAITRKECFWHSFFVMIDVVFGQRTLVRLCHRNEVEMYPLLSANKQNPTLLCGVFALVYGLRGGFELGASNFSCVLPLGKK